VLSDVKIDFISRMADLISITKDRIIERITECIEADLDVS